MTDAHELDVERLLSERGWLAGLARRLTSDAELARDIEQETWLRALRKPLAIRSPRAWLGSIARNVLAERRRAESRRIAREKEVAPLESGDEDSLRRAALQRDIISELLRLEEPDRSAVTLRYLEQRSYGEVAAALGITEAAARKRVSRGIKSLRELLDAEHGSREAWVLLALPWTGWRGGAHPAATLQASVPVGAPDVALPVLTMNTTKIAGAAAFVLVAGILGGRWLMGSAGEGQGLGTMAPGAVATLPRDAGEVLSVDTALETRTALGAPASDAGELVALGSSVPAFPERLAATLGTLDLRVRWSDGTPAAGVAVELLPWGDPTPIARQKVLRTNEQGQLRVLGLNAGRVGVYVDRGGGGGAEILAGGVTPHEVVIPAGSRVYGVVRDPDGTPVPHASVLLSGYFNAGHGKVVARSDAQGHYEVRDLHDAHYIAARAEGFRPGFYQLLNEMAPGSAYEVDLAVRRGGGAVRGQVVDGNGTPVSGAKIRISVAGDVDTSGDRRSAFEIVLSTDESGRFESREAGSGRVTVKAKTESFEDAEVTIETGSDEAENMRIALTFGAELTGTACLADGRPAANASVWVKGRSGSSRSRGKSCITDAHGRYRIRGLQSGRFEVAAHQKDAGKAEGAVQLRRGEPAVWNPTLAAGRSVSGRVVDGAGEPLGGWMVGTQTGRMLWDRHTRSEPDGTFELLDVREDAQRLHVTTPTGWLLGTLVLAKIEEGGTVIVVPDSVLPSASVSLRVLADGKPLDPPPEVTVTQANGGYRQVFTNEVGEAELSGIMPGDFRLSIRVAGRAPFERSGTLLSDESLDLGTINLVRGGRVRLKLSAPSAPSDLTLSSSVVVRRADGSLVDDFNLIEGSGASEALAPGDYVLWCWGQLSTGGPQQFSVTDGETTEISANAVPTGTATLTLRSEQPSGLHGTLYVSAILPAGTTVLLRENVTPDHSGDYRLHFPCLPAGSSTIEATAGTGLSASVVIDVDPSTPKGLHMEQVLELH